MSVIEAVILGIIQGVTEFLPVSSSGHLELAKILAGIQTKDRLLFSVMVHGATALSTIVVFHKYIWELIRGVFRIEWNFSTQYLLKIVISMIPVGIIGVMFEDQIDAFFSGRPVLVGSMLIFTGVLLFLTHYGQYRKGDVSYGKAFLIGIAQAIAVMPGISRSGATISTSLMAGVDRHEAARFSFIMVLPPILGATALKVKDYFEAPAVAADMSGATLSAGFISAFVAGVIACRWMIGIVQRGKLSWFALYCFLVGSIAIIWSLYV